MNLDAPLLLQYVYTVEIITFSICMLALPKQSRSVKVWLLSNFTTLAASILFIVSLKFQNDEFAQISAALNIISAGIRSIAFSGSMLWRRSNLFANILVILTFIFGLLLIIFAGSSYRLLFVGLGGLSAALASLLFVLSNKQWAGLRPIYFTAIVLIASSLFMLFSLSQSYPIGDQTRFAGDGDSEIIRTVMLCVFMFLFHMAFIELSIARQNRRELLQFRRINRVQATIEKSNQRERQSAELAEERDHLLKMLTHEVRQPLNTAQAALHNVIYQLDEGKTAAIDIQKIAVNAQLTLNSIVLSISNSILGATLITKGRTSPLESIDLCSVAELALLDLDQSQRHRVQKKLAQPVLFTDADPIVMRLAIRNLLENALKFSPPKTSVLFDLVIDAEKLALDIRITNELIDPTMLSIDIFQLNRRGIDSKYDRSGLGLYIVNQVAEMHKGSLSYRVVDDNVTFELSIPG